MNCVKCNKTLSGKDQKKFCSRSCSVCFNNRIKIVSEEQKQKTSQTLKKRADKKGRKYPYENGTYIRTCIMCNVNFPHNKPTKHLCSKSCQDKLKRIINKQIEERIGGVWQRRNSRSRGERLFAEKLTQVGINVITNKKMFEGFDADVILPDYKLAIHWNGAWHWKPIVGESLLNKIKSRDSKRYQMIEQYGYINYIIIDHKFTSPEQAADINFRKIMHLLRLERRPGDYLSDRV